MINGIFVQDFGEDVTLYEVGTVIIIMIVMAVVITLFYKAKLIYKVIALIVGFFLICVSVLVDNELVFSLLFGVGVVLLGYGLVGVLSKVKK